MFIHTSEKHLGVHMLVIKTDEEIVYFRTMDKDAVLPGGCVGPVGTPPPPPPNPAIPTTPTPALHVTSQTHVATTRKHQDYNSPSRRIFLSRACVILRALHVSS